MKVLVTGGTGFTGKALVRRLLDEGHKVVALDYKEGLKTQELREWGAEVIIGSVVDKEVVEKSIEGIDIIFHLAAAFRELNVANDYYYTVNVEGTKNVLESAFSHKVKKFIYCSTCGVHGNIVNEYYKKGMKTVILRPAAIYGPGDPERFFMIFKRVAKGSFPMFGSGKTFYHPLYIDNLVDAFILAMDENKGVGQAYLIADEKYLEIKDLVKRVGKALDINVKIKHYPILPVMIAGHIAEKVCKPFKITPPIFPRRVDWFRQNRAFKIDKAKEELGYNPKIGIDEGLRKTAEWYRKENYL